MRTDSRRAASLALVAVCAIASVLVARGRRKPFSPEAPAFRKLGPESAKVLIVEFSDFQCPSCRYAEKPLQDVLKVYAGKVRFTFKHFPLPMHESAKTAAVAAECAGRQGKFWEYHHILYDRQNEWPGAKADDFLRRYAKEVRLDAAPWQACREGADALAAVERDQKDGENAWVGGTPTFFIEGRRFVGARQLSELGTLHIERQLRK